jgi:hypothetical protein
MPVYAQLLALTHPLVRACRCQPPAAATPPIGQQRGVASTARTAAKDNSHHDDRHSLQACHPCSPNPSSSPAARIAHCPPIAALPCHVPTTVLTARPVPTTQTSRPYLRLVLVSVAPLHRSNYFFNGESCCRQAAPLGPSWRFS